MAAMMNMTNLLNGKDSRWLQLEVCREFQRNKCSRPDTECKFAHPPANVEVQNGRVTACYDSIKGRCNREKPPCKYFHPPQHLKDQLLINGRNHLALKNAIMQQMGISPGQPVLPGQVPAVATNPYLASMPASTYSPYFPPGHLMPTLLGPADPATVSQLGPVVQQAVVPTAQQKIPRSDRLEAFPGMVPYKRTAADKSGIPVYQPGATTYQQLMQLQQPFVPVSCEYPTPSSSATSATYIPQTSTTATLIANNSSSNSAPSTILTSSSYYTSSGNSVNNNNNNNSKVNNKNTTLAKSLSLQSVSSVGTGLGHLTNGQAHSDSDLSAKPDGLLGEKDDLSAVSSAAAAVSGSDASSSLLTLTPTAAASTPASQAMVSTSATQSVPAPITSAMLNYSVSAAQINNYNASIQAQAQAVHAAQAAAVAQANQAAAASAQYSAHYADAANLAKEVAQKNYANALKMAAASNALTGKPLTALSYTGVALNKSSLMTPAQTYGAATAGATAAAMAANPAAAPAYPPPRIGTPAVAVAAATPQQTLLPALSRPPPPILPQAAFTQMLRPQMPANLMHNPYAAAAAVAQQQQQLMSQAGFMYPATAFQAAAGYQFGSPMHTAIPAAAANLTAIPGAMSQVPQVAATPTPGSAVVLNPYKKMKTS